ncbi:12985_t:CDS:10 [Entrophospora sp. SA101]|nr:12985_t:CDS:10 [Entrophospora sp. SA101]
MSSPREQLLFTLSEAASQEPERIKGAETQLKQWEVAPEFYSTLLDIIYDKSIHLNVRFLGVIFFKNGVDRYWRKTAKNTINPQEKAKIRSRILSFMDEEHNQLATQNAVLVSKIARFDFPNEWPDLLRNLLSIIHSTINSTGDSQQILIQKRALLTLHLVVKALCSKTFGPDRKMMEQIAPELLRNVANIYVEHVNRFFNIVSSSNNILGNNKDLETSLSALKCIRRLIVHGFHDISKADEVKSSFPLLLEHLQKFYTLRNNLQDEPSQIFELVKSHINLIGKFFIDLQKSHPISFALIPESFDIVLYYWQLLVFHAKSYESDILSRSPGLEKILVQGLLLLKGIIKKSSYNQDLRESKDSRISEAIQSVEKHLLTPPFVESCCELLVSNLIVLRKGDLTMWEDDPEGWVNFDENDHWEYQLRVERVFMDLLSQYRDPLSTRILSMLETVASIHMNDLLFKDAVYCAIGLGAHELYDVLDFDSWLVNNLLIEAANDVPSFKIIRRRIAWLIGRWVCVKLSKENRPKVYDVMTYLMRPEEDLVVRMTAAINLKEYILTFEIAPFAEKITNLLPPMWQAAHNEHLFKPAILVILTKLVEALSDQSSKLHEFIIPIIQYSVDPNTEEHVYLLEDALDLWLATLQNVTECTQSLFSLVPLTITLLEFGSETLKKVLRIIESYIVLVPDLSIQTYAHPILDAFARMLGDLKPEACRSIIHVLDTILQCCSIQVLGESIIGSGLLWKLLNTMLSGNEEYPYVMVSYISILARMVINNLETFFQFINVAAQQYNLIQSDILSKLLEIWLDKFDNIGHPKQRKLNAMAFAALIATDNPAILKCLQQFIGVWCDVLSEVKESGGGDALVYWQEDSGEDEEFTIPEAKRKRILLQNDPIHTTNLIQFIHLKLKECETINGGAEMFRINYLSKVDDALLDQLNTH